MSRKKGREKKESSWMGRPGCRVGGRAKPRIYEGEHGRVHIGPGVIVDGFLAFSTPGLGPSPCPLRFSISFMCH